MDVKITKILYWVSFYKI